MVSLSNLSCPDVALPRACRIACPPVQMITTLFLWAAAASADPRPEMRGNQPPPANELTLSASTLIGPLAPANARDWLTLIAPSFHWGEPEVLERATLAVANRDFASLTFDGSTSRETQAVALRLYHDRKTDLVAVSETGACCCGSCIARIHFFEVRNDALIDVTDRVWPRFRFVTNDGLTSDPVIYELAPRGPYVVIRDRLTSRVVYRLKRSSESGRFELIWRRKGAAAPYERDK